MKNTTEIYGKNLGELLREVQIFDDIALCRLICDYYSKYESPVYVGNPELFKMIALSNAGHKVYSTLSLGWESGVPYKQIADISMELDFRILVFAVSWDKFNEMAKRIENLATKCTIKLFSVKGRARDKGLDKGLIMQLIDWIENDVTPVRQDDVKCKTIPR